MTNAMNILTVLKNKLEYNANLRQYDLIREEIDRLHEEIDNLSIRLGQLVKLKCEIEQMLAKQEQ